MKTSALISLDHEQWDHKPSTKLQYKDQVDKFGNPRSEVRVIGARIGSEIEKVTPTSLARFISRGQTWSPFVFNECPQWKRPRRIEALFKSCQVFALDFDNGESVEDVVAQAKALGLSFNLIHHSFSSTPEHPKLRGILFVEKEIVEFDTARLYSTALAHAFEGADRQCIDVARLYFGSRADSIVSVSSDSVVEVATLEKIAGSVEAEKFLVKGERNVSKPDNTEWGDAKVQRALLAGLSASKRSYVKRKVLGILKDVETFDGSKGSRYECVWRNASRLSRMPEVVGSAVYQWMLESIEKNPYFADWEWDTKSVVMNAIEWSSTHADDPV
jgi:hypothetical protein